MQVMSKETKGYKEEREPCIIALDNYLKQSDSRSVKETARILQAYLNSDLSENSFYQRIIKLRNEEYKNVSEEESQAIYRFLHVEKNPHTYGQTLHSIKNLSGKVDQLKKFIQSGYINQIAAGNILKELKTLNSLSTNTITENAK